MVDNQISFEIVALLPSPMRWAKKRANFKINLFVDQTRSFLFSLCSRLVEKLAPITKLRNVRAEFDFHQSSSSLVEKLVPITKLRKNIHDGLID